MRKQQSLVETSVLSFLYLTWATNAEKTCYKHLVSFYYLHLDSFLNLKWTAKVEPAVTGANILFHSIICIYFLSRILIILQSLKQESQVQSSTFFLVSELVCKPASAQPGTNILFHSSICIYFLSCILNRLQLRKQESLVRTSTFFLASELGCKRASAQPGENILFHSLIRIYFISCILIRLQIRKEQSTVQTSTFFLVSELDYRRANSKHW
jgi:hypothetical protein